MLSEKKLEANRRNASKSTGPKTEEGKAKSSQNAITHGVFVTKCHILPGENEAEYAAFQAEMLRDLQPRGIVQRELVDDIVQTRWRLRRLARVESQKMLNRQNKIADNNARVLKLNKKYQPESIDPIILLAEGSGGESYVDLYRERLQRTFHTQLRELRKLREETGQHEDDTHTRDTGLRPVPDDVGVEKECSLQIDHIEHGPEARVTVNGKNEPTAEHKAQAEQRLENRHDALTSAVNAVADSLMLSMDDLKEASSCSTGFQPVPGEPRDL